MCSEPICKVHKNILVIEFLFQKNSRPNSATLLKKASLQVVFKEFFQTAVLLSTCCWLVLTPLTAVSSGKNLFKVNTEEVTITCRKRVLRYQSDQ